MPYFSESCEDKKIISLSFIEINKMLIKNLQLRISQITNYLIQN